MSDGYKYLPKTNGRIISWKIGTVDPSDKKSVFLVKLYVPPTTAFDDVEPTGQNNTLPLTPDVSSVKLCSVGGVPRNVSWFIMTFRVRGVEVHWMIFGKFT